MALETPGKNNYNSDTHTPKYFDDYAFVGVVIEVRNICVNSPVFQKLVIA